MNFRSMRLTSHITHVNYLAYDFEFKMRNVTGNRCVPIANMIVLPSFGFPFPSTVVPFTVEVAWDQQRSLLATARY